MRLVLSEYEIAREQLDCLLEISSPKLLRDFFKKYPPAVLPDLFIRINKRELDYLAGVCQLTGEAHYRNWAWLPRNAAPELEELASRGLSPIDAVAESGLPKRCASLLLLHARCTYRFQENRSRSRAKMGRSLGHLKSRYSKIEGSVREVLKDLEGRRMWDRLQKELKRYLFMRRIDFDRLTEQRRLAIQDSSMPHHNTSGRYVSGDIYRVARAIAEMYQKKGEKEAQKATRELFQSIDVTIQKSSFSTWLSRNSEK